jgi:hypothetical protein
MSPQRKGSNRLITWLRALITATVLIAVCFALISAIKQLERHPLDWQQVRWGWLAPALLTSLAANHCAAWFWWRSLNQLHAPQPLAKTYAAFFSSQLGKYVPGKAMVVVIRSAFAKSQGVPLGIAIASTFLETLLWLATGAGVASIGLLVWYPQRYDLLAVSIPLFVVFAWATCPPIFSRLALRIGTIRPSSATNPVSPNLSDSGPPPTEVPSPEASVLVDQIAGGSTAVSNSRSHHHFSWACYAAGVGAMSLGWALVGLSLCCIQFAFSAGNHDLSLFGPLLTAITLATAIGFVTLIPGGLGVRELVLIPLLAPQLGIDQSVAIAILARLITLCAEILAIGIWRLAEHGSQFSWKRRTTS